MTEEEEELAKAYARANDISLAEAFKQALFEKIEDEFDLKVAKGAYAEYLKDPSTVPFEELLRKDRHREDTVEPTNTVIADQRNR